MKCNHCGLCCRDARTQISITLGDIYRISKYLEVSVEELFKEKIGIQPFADADLLHYDLDIGLELPCKFRIEERCSIYSVRPLNCRLFPIWILADAPFEKLKDILAEHECEWDMTKREKYKEYTKIVGDILLSESEMFNFGGKIDISQFEWFTEEMSENKKIVKLKELFGIKLPIKLIEKIMIEHQDVFEKNNEELKKAEL